MSEIVYITPEQARDTHHKTIKHSGGGTLEELEFEKLVGVLNNIQNDEWYPTFVDKLTHLFFCTCQFHCFADGNKRLAITLSTLFLLLNGYMGIAHTFIGNMENISLQVAASKIDKELLHKIMEAIMTNTFDEDETLKLEIYNAIK
ncbi:putative death-on-curing protein of phage P1 [Selenomonas ruminantium subsp. lactilytica TAM6421]|uniref:Putative death-on-curing protein of phage P1 n=1 Tax=Selenomonas ruminantium subsp. lactilytica (strain NBRC 103574 / TAM6421) TaxID=927704 RepID=I0GSQ4_SELRL|nr:Fic family protein [Selenomonas ruminantium]BAL83791.1 putative death-on-curing protein of phage P1 [Selenomonas ruminantium subsp. lactilytica TAM6421]